MATQSKVLGWTAPIPAGDWDGSKTYNPLNLVRHKTASFIAKSENKGIEPRVTTGWENVWQIMANDGETICVADGDVTSINYTLEDNVDKSYTADGITQVKITVPAKTVHGFISGVNIKVGEKNIPLEIINNSAYAIKYVRNGYGTDGITDLTANKNSLFTFFCDGINVYCVLAEV